MVEAGRIQSYRDLQVWQLGMDLAEGCYLLTKRLPKDELFGMTSQIRRAASSVPANIAEGYGRDSKGEYIQFLRVAQGSLKELETHLTLSRRVGLMSESETKNVLEECDHLGRMLHRLI
ncbi:S23 ribosomal protein [Acidobacteriia bacterium SbA2]|nr:S23 ribosomal protein [Acidobacteriia bacterium SbA2]